MNLQYKPVKCCLFCHTELRAYSRHTRGQCLAQVRKNQEHLRLEVEVYRDMIAEVKGSGWEPTKFLRDKHILDVAIRYPDYTHKQLGDLLGYERSKITKVLNQAGIDHRSPRRNWRAEGARSNG